MQNTITSLLHSLKLEQNYRALTPMKHEGIFLSLNGEKLLNLASNDYLSIAQDEKLAQDFLKQASLIDSPLSSSSSRILSGNFAIFEALENHLSALYGAESALLFNSGYHANLGIIDALAKLPSVLFLCDSFMHASVFDGLRISRAKFLRFPHNDTTSLQSLLSTHRKNFQSVIILSEGIFSMEGDLAPLGELVALKERYDALLYLDEAHSVGTCGEDLLGLASYLKLTNAIDFLVLAFGKALGSVGGCVLCDEIFKSYFINKARPLIYSTALPPISAAFSLFVLEHLAEFRERAVRLRALGDYLRGELSTLGQDFIGGSHIISLMAYENATALELSHKLRKIGYFAPAIKSPSVPEKKARIRLSLTSNLEKSHFDNLLEMLRESNKGTSCK